MELKLYIKAERVEIDSQNETRKNALFVHIIRAHDCATFVYIAFGNFY